MERRLITNPILSALHLRGPKSYIYMFTSIEEINDWLGFHYQSETINWHGNSKYYKTLTSTEVIIFVPYNLKLSSSFQNDT